MHWSLWGVSHLGLAKLVNCNQILGHVADQDCVEFIDSFGLLIQADHCYVSFSSCSTWKFRVTTKSPQLHISAQKYWSLFSSILSAHILHLAIIFRLDTSYVDLYLIHSPLGGKLVQTFKAMCDLKNEGLIRLGADKNITWYFHDVCICVLLSWNRWFLIFYFWQIGWCI